MTASTFENPTIPWPLVPLKRVLRFRNGEPFAHVESSHGDYPVYGSGGEFARADDFLHDGTSVLFGRKGTVDKPLLVRGRFWCIDTMFYTRLDPSVDARFVHYFATTIPYTLLATDTARPSMTQTDLGEVKMPFPSLQEQRAIADLLDRETAQIDAMIEAQVRLIEDLESRQIAVIRHLTEAERNGWPEGRVKHLGNVTLGKMLTSRPSSTADTEQNYLRAANVQPLGALDLTDMKSMWFTPAEVNRLDLREGDVVVVEGGQGGFGRAAYLPLSLPDTGFQNSINRVRMQSGNSGRFLSYSLIAARAAGLMHAMCPAVSMPHMTAEKLAAFPVATPPPAEQRLAVSRIDGAMQQTGRTIAAAQTVVTLLRERRAALIAAAVTGRIDPTTGIEQIAPTTKKEAS